MVDENIPSTRKQFAKAWNIYQKLIGGSHIIKNPEVELNRVFFDSEKETVRATYGWYDDTYTIPTTFFEYPDKIPSYVKESIEHEMCEIKVEIGELIIREDRLKAYLETVRKNENEIDWSEI